MSQPTQAFTSCVIDGVNFKVIDFTAQNDIPPPHPLESRVTDASDQTVKDSFVWRIENLMASGLQDYEDYDTKDVSHHYIRTSTRQLVEFISQTREDHLARAIYEKSTLVRILGGAGCGKSTVAFAIWSTITSPCKVWITSWLKVFDVLVFSHGTYYKASIASDIVLQDFLNAFFFDPTRNKSQENAAVLFLDGIPLENDIFGIIRTLRTKRVFTVTCTASDSSDFNSSITSKMVYRVVYMPNFTLDEYFQAKIALDIDSTLYNRSDAVIRKYFYYCGGNFRIALESSTAEHSKVIMSEFIRSLKNKEGFALCLTSEDDTIVSYLTRFDLEEKAELRVGADRPRTVSTSAYVSECLIHSLDTENKIKACKNLLPYNRKYCSWLFTSKMTDDLSKETKIFTLFRRDTILPAYQAKIRNVVRYYDVSEISQYYYSPEPLWSAYIPLCENNEGFDAIITLSYRNKVTVLILQSTIASKQDCKLRSAATIMNHLFGIDSGVEYIPGTNQRYPVFETRSLYAAPATKVPIDATIEADVYLTTEDDDNYSYPSRTSKMARSITNAGQSIKYSNTPKATAKHPNLEVTVKYCVVVAASTALEYDDSGQQRTNRHLIKSHDPNFHWPYSFGVYTYNIGPVSGVRS